MKLINSDVKIIPQEVGLLGVYKQIELAGRTAYKSEDRITNDSARAFVEMLVSRGHTAPLEQGTIYLDCPKKVYDKYAKNKYSKVNTYIEENYGPIKWVSNGVGYIANKIHYYVTTNARVIYENDWISDLFFACDPTEHHSFRVTAKFTCSRAVANEIVRHRAFSFVQESTRYCNYSKDKFDNQITYIIPTWLNLDPGNYIQVNLADYKNTDTKSVYTTLPEISFLSALKSSESEYFELLNYGCKPQEAREVLPLGLKTEIIVTGFIEDWNEFFKLRCDNAAHPDMRYLANKLKDLIENQCE